MKGLFSTSLAAALVLMLLACNVKLKGSGDSPPPVDKGIAGPDISGTWLSDCRADWMTSGYKMLEVTYRNKSTSRKSRSFADANCTRLSAEKVEDGTFKFVQVDPDGSYTIEYRFPIGNGIHALPKEKIILENTTLWISDYVAGQAVQKSLMFQLKKVAP